MLEGQDILVIGTPYHAEFIYKLAAFSMGLEFDEDEKMQPQTISHNGYRFQFTTFQDEGLRKVHLWMIESELEQAVGRARLLRNRCEVASFLQLPPLTSQSWLRISIIREFDLKIYVNGVAEMAAPIIFEMNGFRIKRMLGEVSAFIALFS